MRTGQIVDCKQEERSVVQAKTANQTSTDFPLSRFWVRDIGLSCKFTRVSPLRQLPQAEQLFAALLRGDRARALELIVASSTGRFDELLGIVEKINFGRTILDRVFSLQLASALPEQFRTALSKQATREAAAEKVLDNVFAQVLSMLGLLREDIVWTKGTSLSRTVYKGNNKRMPGDFDMVVRQSKYVEVAQVLEANGYTRIETAKACNQYGVGPTTDIGDLLLSPDSRFVPTSSMSLLKTALEPIDVKLSPCDTGVRMQELERFFQDATRHSVMSEEFLAPSIVDHLMLCCHNFAKDRFRNWKSIFDIHILTTAMNKDAALWQEFSRRCQVEALEPSVWAALCVARDRLSSPVPDTVLAALQPPSTFAHCLFTFTVSPFFVWNATSLPMMLLSAAMASNWRLRLKTLIDSFFPEKSFLEQYYSHGNLRPAFILPTLITHWLVLILPGGVVRQSFGKLLWPRS